MAIAILVAVGYICVVTFVSALLTAARRGDELPDPAETATGARHRFVSEEELELTPEDTAFLERLSRR